jgi:hypothetical protein
LAKDRVRDAVNPNQSRAIGELMVMQIKTDPLERGFMWRTAWAKKYSASLILLSDVGTGVQKLK